MNSKKTIYIKIIIVFISLMDFILYLSDFVFLLSWLTKYNFYNIAAFIKEKPYLSDDAFAYNVPDSIISYWYVSLVLLIFLTMLVIIDIFLFKEERILFIILYSVLLIIISIITVFVIRHHNLLIFYDSPANDLPWDYRKWFCKRTL